MNVCLAVIWMMSVRFDQLGEKERPGTREEVRRVSVLSTFFHQAAPRLRFVVMFAALT